MTKEQQIKKYLNKPFEVGDTVYVRGLGIKDKNNFGLSEVIVNIKDGLIGIKVHKQIVYYPPKDCKYSLRHIGVNPFPKRSDVRITAYDLRSILFNLAITEERERYTNKKGEVIKEVCWNPYIIDSLGNKIFYQRDFVWTLEDNQNLIDSIYLGIDCGKILVRKRSWEEVDNQDEPAFNDIVDGKQRLNAIRGFILNKYPDSQGNYYKELSDSAQHQLTNHQLFSFGELPEDSKDQDVIEQFLRLNFCGVPQSKEHIDFVKSIKI